MYEINFQNIVIVYQATLYQNQNLKLSTLLTHHLLRNSEKNKIIYWKNQLMRSQIALEVILMSAATQVKYLTNTPTKQHTHIQKYLHRYLTNNNHLHFFLFNQQLKCSITRLKCLLINYDCYFVCCLIAFTICSFVHWFVEQLCLTYWVIPIKIFI